MRVAIAHCSKSFSSALTRIIETIQTTKWSLNIHSRWRATTGFAAVAGSSILCVPRPCLRHVRTMTAPSESRLKTYKKSYPSKFLDGTISHRNFSWRAVESTHSAHPLIVHWLLTSAKMQSDGRRRSCARAVITGTVFSATSLHTHPRGAATRPSGTHSSRAPNFGS